MAVHLVASLKDRLQGRARQLELSSGLERDGAAEIARWLLQRDYLVIVVNRAPAEALRQATQQCRYARRPLVGNGPQAVAMEGNLLVLGADSPLGLRLCPLLDMRHE